jgi:epoxyqueuosine reductase
LDFLIVSNFGLPRRDTLGKRMGFMLAKVPSLEKVSRTPGLGRGFRASDLTGLMMDSPLRLTTSLISFARNLGFIAVGFSKPHRPAHFDFFLSRLADRKHADMTWLEGNLDVRADPSKLLEGCQTIISLAYPYPNARHETEDGYRVARYADPSKEDYHFRLKRLGEDLSGLIQKDYPESRARACVDSSPILEKSIAWRSGLGFIGKNTLLVIPGYGSYLFLVEILTTAPLQHPIVEPMPDQCGTCTSCMKACPTGALEKPYHLNASKCLAYLTIEHKGDIRPALGPEMRRCFLGCDRCQEACPFNKVAPTINVSMPSADEILCMGEEQFNRRFGKTSLARPGMKKIKSNLRAARS